MDSKEGIEKVAPVDAQAAELLDPSFLRPGTHDAATADPPRERADSPTGSCVSPDEHPRRESNCLYIRVLRDSDAILEQDCKVPALVKTFVRPGPEWSWALSPWTY